MAIKNESKIDHRHFTETQVVTKHILKIYNPISKGKQQIKRCHFQAKY